jgi:type IV fimbrial biogenesis protein FimT
VSLQAFSRSKGVTVVELMMAIAIAGILTAIALPSFSSSLASNRMANTANEFLATVAFARSEAMRNNRGSVFCASADGSACGGGWEDGWIVWADANADGVRQTSGPGEEPVLRRQGPLLKQESAGGATTIRFSARGSVIAGTGAIVLRAEGCSSGQPFQRSLQVLAGGMARVQRQNCP